MPFVLHGLSRPRRLRSGSELATIRLLGLTALAVAVYDIFVLTILAR